LCASETRKATQTTGRRTTNDGWTSGIQIQAMPVKVGNVSLFSYLIVGRSFSFRFATNLSPSPNTRCQDRENYPLLLGADAKSAVRCVTGQDQEHGARGSNNSSLSNNAIRCTN
jgi:hypothetical protein